MEAGKPEISKRYSHKFDLKARLLAGNVSCCEKNKAVSVGRLKPLLFTGKEILSLQL